MRFLRPLRRFLRVLPTRLRTAPFVPAAAARPTLFTALMPRFTTLRAVFVATPTVLPEKLKRRWRGPYRRETIPRFERVRLTIFYKGLVFLNKSRTKNIMDVHKDKPRFCGTAAVVFLIGKKILIEFKERRKNELLRLP